MNSAGNQNGQYESQALQNSLYSEQLRQLLQPQVALMNSFGMSYQPTSWGLDTQITQQTFESMYCLCDSPDCGEVAASSPSHTNECLTEKDLEVIRKLTKSHLGEHLKSKKLVLKEVAGYPSDSDVVFKSKSKGCKALADGTKVFRGSRFRGVSVNGKSWQVFIVINKIKCYAGCVNTEKQAASLYDKLAIIFHGLKVGFQISNFHRLRQTSPTQSMK